MIVKGPLRKYIGAISSQEQAARYYDKYSMIIQGFKVSLKLLNYNRPRLTSRTRSRKR